MHVAVLTSEGRILFWELEFQQVGVYGQDFGDEDPLPTMITARPLRGAGLVNIEEEDEGVGGVWDVNGLTLGDSIAPHWFTPPDGESKISYSAQQSKNCSLLPDSSSIYGLLSIKMILGNLWVGLPSTPTAIRMCPPLTTKNWLFYTPKVAIGTANGSLLIYNLHTRVMVKEFSVHSCPVR